MAISETCAEGSDPQCISVGEQYVLRPSAFERAAVDDAAVADGNQQNAVEVTFSAEGATVLNMLTKKAAAAGEQARLVLKIGDSIRAAVIVPEALEGNQITILLSPDDSAQDVVSLLHEN